MEFIYDNKKMIKGLGDINVNQNIVHSETAQGDFRVVMPCPRWVDILGIEAE